MTTPTTDPLRDYLAALPRRCRDHLNITETVVSAVHTAIRDQRWTAQQLADESARDLTDARNIGATITDRLRKAALHEPAGRGIALPTAARLPFCTPHCRDNAGWVINQDTGQLIGRCPCRTPQGATA